MKQTNLRPLAHEAIRHWRAHLPKMYHQLKAAGKLDQEAMIAAQKTLDEQATLVSQGVPIESAWEMVRENYLFRPEEPGTTPEAPPSAEFRDAQATQRVINKTLQEL